MNKIPKMKTIRYQIWYVNLNKKWYDIRNYSRLECIFWGGRRSVVLVGVVVTVVSKWWLWDVNEKGSQAWCYSLLSRYIIQVCKMLHLFVSTFRHGALISSYISKWWLRAANEMGSQLWCYISLSRYIIQVCKMLHLSGSTFPHGALISSYIAKWCLWDTSEMGSQPWCYISLSRHIIQVCEMLHLSGSTFRHGALFSSYICKWWLLHVDSGHMVLTSVQFNLNTS